MNTHHFLKGDHTNFDSTNFIQGSDQLKISSGHAPTSDFWTPNHCGAFSITTADNIDPFEIEASTGLIKLQSGQSWPMQTTNYPFTINIALALSRHVETLPLQFRAVVSCDYSSWANAVANHLTLPGNGVIEFGPPPMTSAKQKVKDFALKPDSLHSACFADYKYEFAFATDSMLGATTDENNDHYLYVSQVAA